MKTFTYISFAAVFFILTGCVNTSNLLSNIDSVTYESTLSSPNIGYIDYQSRDLLGNTNQQLFVSVSYIGKNGPFDTRKIEIKNVKPKDGYVRIYIPSFKDEHFEGVDLDVDYGTVRVIGVPINDVDQNFKRLEKGQPTKVTLQNKNVTITSEITLPGTYTAILLKRIIK